jgi:hypothetical protein
MLITSLALNQFTVQVQKQPLTFTEPQSDLFRDGNLRHKDGLYTYTISSGKIFQSYQTVVAFTSYCGNHFIDERYYKYSKTTSKYLSEFLGSSAKEIAKAIKSGDIRLCSIHTN